MSVGQKIKMLRKSKGWTQKELAEKLQLAPTAVSAWERDANRPMMDSLAKMSELFDVTIDSFYPTSNDASIIRETSNLYQVSPITARIPVLGTIACGDPILAEENINDYRTVLAEGLPTGNLFYLEAKGNSMAPTIPNGAMVMIREQPDVENGEIAAVLVNGNEEATLKRIKKQDDMMVLMPDNPNHEPIIVTKNHPAKIIGKAVRFEQDL